VASYTEIIDRIMRGDYEEASDADRDDAIRSVIQACSITAAAVTIQPIPFVDTALITPIQIVMVQAIARIHGYQLDKKSVVEILSTFGASILAQNVIMAAVKFIPFLGWIVTTSMAYALTWAVGEVSDYYFRNGRGVPQEELQSMFNRIYREKHAEKKAANSGDGTLKEKLEQLKEAFDAGLLEESEFNKKKEDVLSGF
jgi:uncharacterized protein (DUF697 family)